jgi:hypothetical protein
MSENVGMQGATPAKKKPAPMGSPLGFRVPDDVKAALEKAAEDDTRSVSSLALKIITDWLKTKGYLK